MYRGNMPGQYNGASGVPSGQEYTHPMYGSRAPPHPSAGAPTSMQTQMMTAQAGVQQPQSAEIQRFQSVSGYPGSGQVQPGYGAPPTGSYSATDPYMYGHSKMMPVRSSQQSFPPDMAPSSMSSASGSHMYAASMQNQSRMPGSYPSAVGSSMPHGSDNSAGMQYRHSKVGGTMYNGSQYISSGMQMASQVTPEQRQAMQHHARHPMSSQVPSSYQSGDVSQPLVGSMQQQQQYGQQQQNISQYQQRPGMVASSTAVSMGMYGQSGHQQYPNQVSGGQKTPAQYDEQMLQMQQQAQSQGSTGQAQGNIGPSAQQQQPQQAGLSQMQQNVMQSQMKPNMTPTYRGKMQPANAQATHQSQQMLGMPGHPMQPSISPHHNSPVSPMRSTMTSRQTTSMPPSPLPSRTTSQYPAPQASPRMHQAGPMSPNARMPSYSPKQQMQQGQQFMSQGQMTPGYRANVTPSRTPTPRNEQSSRGFMSPPHMMSPPPAAPSVARSPAPRMQVPSYNGENTMSQQQQQQQQQQQHSFYSNQMRYPHGSWQGPRPPVPSPGGAGMPRMPHQQAQSQVPRFDQQHQMYSSAVNQPSQVAPTMSMGVRPQRQPNVQYSVQNQVPATLAPTMSVSQSQPSVPSTDFDSEFNLDSLLGDAMDGTGSFMQQLQEVAPTEAKKQQPETNVPAAVQIPTAQKPTTMLANAAETKPTSLPVVSEAPVGNSVNTGIPIPNLPQSEPAMEISGQPVSTAGPENTDVPNDNTLAMSLNTTPEEKPSSISGEVQQSHDNSVASSADSLPDSFTPSNDTSSVPVSVMSSVVPSSAAISNQLPTPNIDAAVPTMTSPVSNASLSPVKKPNAMESPLKPTDEKTPGMDKPLTTGGPQLTPGPQPVSGPLLTSGPQAAQGPHPASGTLPPSGPHPAPGPHPVSGALPTSGPNFPGTPTSANAPYSSSSGPYRPNMPPSSMQSHPGGPMRPQGDPSAYPPQYRPPHPHGMPGMHPQQPGGPSHPRGMHPHDGSMVRGPGPQYPGMHPSHQYPGHPHQPHPYRYGPHPQASATPYMPGSGPPHTRGPYPQPGPRMQGGLHGYPGPRPGYPPGMHPNQHLQQRLQVLRHEAQQLQSQMQRAQQEESENPVPPPPAPDPTLAPDQQPPLPPPPKSEQIKRRLMEVDGQIRQIMSQLHAQGPPPQHPQMMQEQGGPMTTLSGPPGFPPHDANSPSKPGEDGSTPGKKKRPRKKAKAGKGESEEGTKKDKPPPKKKKKKDASEGDDAASGGEKKKKKKKKAEKVVHSDGGIDGDISVLKPEDEIGDDTSTTINDTAILDDDSAVGDNDSDSQKILSISDKQKLSKSPEKRKKKPPATLVKQKKKRKRGYDSSDEMNASDVLQATPPPSPDDSLIEKRRSGRNVKRKRYTESIELQFSGDDDETDFLPQETSRKHEPIVEMNDVAEEDEVMIVEKILVHRIRSKRVRRKSDTVTEVPGIPTIAEETNQNQEQNGEETKPDAVDKSDAAPPSKDLPPLTVDTNQTHAIPPPMLSPTSLKNPRIRRISMGIVEEEEEVEGEGEIEFFIKYKNYSYLHCDWKTKEEIEDKRFDQKLKRYLAKNTTVTGQLIYPELEMDELFNPDFVTVDRVLDVTRNEQRTDDGQTEVTKHFLTKWCSLPYEDSTWEREEDIDQDKIKQFEARCRYRPGMRKPRPHKDMWRRLSDNKVHFCNNNVLRDYQFEGLNWLLFNWYNKRNCILADEMGLGKTIQSITFLQKIYDHGVKGPFLVVAPLSTIANWQREFESWTTINAVVYHGSQTSRDMLQTYEWFCRDENLDEIEGSYKMQAVITTYEMIVLDSPHLRDVDWRCMIIDEGHRLKNISCKLVESFRNMSLEHKVLLTGTPLQNNVEELFALLSFLQPETFTSQQAFSNEFGNLKDNAQVEKLQELLKPMMLRRLKEDVEKSLAPKQETIIEVELTNIQKKYYRAILERNFEFLAKGTGGGNVPNLMNTMMELRKCCNHPYLIKGAEDKIMAEERRMKENFDALQAMIQSSGKLVLIDKLLPRLKQGGHKVLIFSQMVRVLDILEDYLVQRSYFYERIDGCIRGNERQMAIDRFCRKGSDRFVFLLCTRAGGLGINLTAADTVIIFDSDWNPQNDLQAQARCHRIGQQKLVKIYRLITRNSYEREMFDKASLKLGLDKAVLQSISGRQNQETSQSQGPQLSKSEVEDLLKRGAYGAIMDDDDAASKFCEEDIDQILDRRAHTVTLESGEKGSTFSKASFVSAEDRSDISLDDPNFWEKWARKADLDLERLNDNKLILQIPRSRKQTRRFGGNTDDQEIFAEIGSESDDSDLDSDDETRGKKSKFRSRAGGAGGGQRKGWSRRDCFRIEKCLLILGWGRWPAIQTTGQFGAVVSEDELEEMARTVLMYCLKYYNGDEKIKFFMWDLITPQEIAEKTGVDLRNHEGLAAPVPRGRKGKRAKEDSERQRDEQANREWARDINLESLLPDEGFRKHLQHQCNKVLLRVRMLYYLRVEILGPICATIDANEKHEDIDFDLVDRINDPPMDWWDQDCDKCLLIGVYKHGYEKYNMIRADPNLCYLERVGPPDERLLAAEMDVEPEDTEGDPEYKPTRVTFTELEYDQNSPSSSTPNTEPASPASVDSTGVKSKKDEEQKDDGKPDGEEPVKKHKSSDHSSKDWPSVSELNTRLRRLITMYQKHYKQMQQRLMNMDRRSGRPRYQESGRDSRRPVIQTRWTRREEADFYRTVSTFGIEREPRSGDLLWRRFRNIARLDRKTDESLRWYYLAFRNMCEQVCRWKGSPGTSDGTGVGVGEEIPNIDVDPITEERASRTLYRIRLLDKIRTEVLNHPKLKERLNMCQRSQDLPIWWRCGLHDHELLIAMDKHGVTRTEIHTLNDPNLSFLSSMKEYEANPTAFKQQVLDNEKAELESLLEVMKKEQELKAASAAKNEETAAEKKTETEPKKEDQQERDNIDSLPTKEDAEDTKSPAPGEEKTQEDTMDETESGKDKEEPQMTEDKEERKTPTPAPPPPEDDNEKDQPEISPVSEMEVDEPTSSPPKELEKKEEDGEVEKVQDAEVKDDEQDEPKLEEDNKQEEPKEMKIENLKKEAETDAKPESKPDVDKMDVDDENLSKVEETIKDEKTKQEVEEGKLQMSLRSKPSSNPDMLASLASSYAGMGSLSSSYMIQSMTGRWPKDRVLIQRVENICYCILNGEWPSANQTLLTVSGPQGQSGVGGSRSQSSTPLSFTSDGRGTPISSSGTSSSMLPPVNTDVNIFANQQLQEAMNQLLGATADGNMRMQSYTPRRGRRKRPPANQQGMSTSTSASMPFNASSLQPMDKSLQRKIEQLMAAGNVPFSFAGSSTSNTSSLFNAGFSPSSRGESSTSAMKTSQSSSSKDEELGNSSASLLRELAKTETSSEKSSGSRGRSSKSGYRQSRTHSPSPSRSRAKDQSSKLSQELLKAQQQAIMPTPEQLMAANNSFQQIIQDAVKNGMDPMTAAAAFLPLFPMMDPFQMMNPGKPENFPQLPQLPGIPSPGDMEKVLKSMGLPPELAMMPGILPPGMMPQMPSSSSSQSRNDAKESSSDSKSNQETSKMESASSSISKLSTEKESGEKSIANLIGEKRTTPSRKGGSKLDAMFGPPKSEDESPARSSKKARKSKFVSPAMLPPNTRIPVHNNTEGVRIAGDDAPLNKDLADWLKDNAGFVVDYQALRQQLDDVSSKKGDSSEGALDNSEQESEALVSPLPQSSPKIKDLKSKIMEADELLRSAEKLVQTTKMQQKELELNEKRSSKTPDKSRQLDPFMIPNPISGFSPSTSRAASSSSQASLKQQQQQQLSDLALLQQMGSAQGMDPATAALFSLPPELLGNLANLPPDVAALFAGGLLPGGITPEMLMGMKPPSARLSEDKPSSSDRGSPSRSSTPSRASPSRHSRSHHHGEDRGPPNDPSQLSGNERVTVVNLSNGKKLSGRQAPELNSLAEYLRNRPDMVVTPDWSNVIKKSKFLPKDLHTRLLASQSSSKSSSSKSTSSSSTSVSTSSAQAAANSQAALAAALGGLPPQAAAAMFPGLLQGQGGLMPDPMQLMAALQMPGQPGQIPDMKALAASGLPMLPFFGDMSGFPNPLAFPPQDPNAFAAMAALAQAPNLAPKKEQRSSSSHDRSSSDSGKGRKSRKGDRGSGRSSSSTTSTSTSSQKQSSSFSGDHMADALAALQRGGGIPGMSNPFLAPGMNPMLLPQMMMGGQAANINNLLSLPMDMMNPDLLAAQMAAFGGMPGLDLAAAAASTSKSSSAGGQSSSREQRRGSTSSTSSASKSKDHHSGRSQSRGATDEQPMDLTQFGGGSMTKDRETPDKHK